MTAIVGGLWDALLGRGAPVLDRRDVRFPRALQPDAARPGSDFWPGEYQKTYVHARRTYDDVLDNLRRGRIFAVAGDLITELDVNASASMRTRHRRRDVAGVARRASPDHDSLRRSGDHQQPRRESESDSASI